MGILPPTKGTITIDDITSKRVPINSRRKLSYVSQEQYFYHWANPLQLGNFVAGCYPNWDKADFLDLLDLFSIPRKRRVDQMSGGMKTKLALALSIASNPRVMIFDEPTTGLDPLARREFMDLVVSQSRKHGRTTFFSSHLVNEVERFADVIGIINEGSLLYEGKLDTLLQRTRKLPDAGHSEQLAGIAERWSTLDDQGQVWHLNEDKVWDGLEIPADAMLPASLEDCFLSLVKRSH